MKKIHEILVVDDIKVNVDLLKMRLEKEGYSVICAYNGKEAGEIAFREKPDLILLDVIMPEMDGYELCRKIKNHPETRNIPVVLITSLSGTQDKVRGLESGCDDFLSKPINDIELIARVRSLLKLKDYTDELAIKNIIFQKEIELAGKVQHKILPANAPEMKSYEIDFIYQPCFTVGGDFFYFMDYGNEKLGIVVADVVGHGIQAALITMILKTLLDSFPSQILETDVLLKQMNDHLISILGGKFTYVTGMAAILDAPNGVIKYSSAGHPAAFLHNGSEVIYLKSKGHVMGLFDDAGFEANEQPIRTGDKILFYTDGAYEAEDEDYNIFGDERLEKIFKDNYSLNPRELNSKIMIELKKFVGSKELSDDVNLISIKIKE